MKNASDTEESCMSSNTSMLTNHNKGDVAKSNRHSSRAKNINKNNELNDETVNLSKKNDTMHNSNEHYRRQKLGTSVDAVEVSPMLAFFIKHQFYSIVNVHPHNKYGLKCIRRDISDAILSPVFYGAMSDTLFNIFRSTMCAARNMVRQID